MSDSLKNLTTHDLVDILEDLELECPAGPLTGSAAWTELKHRFQNEGPNPLVQMHDMVRRFNTDILGLPIPSKAKLLSKERGEFRAKHMMEELDEFADARYHENLEDATDSLLDLIYVALGAMVEMGIVSLAAFEEVHAANMRKKRGTLSKRPGSMGHDAVKPFGWEPPDLAPYIALTRGAILNLYSHSVSDKIRPKILVLGYAGHGKDTVCEILRDTYSFKFTGTSMFCAEHIMMPYFNRNGLQLFTSVENCFKDRGNSRQKWFEQIAKYNKADGSRLARELLVGSDIYCGMRSSAELGACRQAGLFDHIIWVDRSLHEPRENTSSCTVEPFMADIILDNNGSLEEMRENLQLLLIKLGIPL